MYIFIWNIYVLITCPSFVIMFARGSPDFLNLSNHTQKRLLQGDSLGPKGKTFSECLCEYVSAESLDFLLRRASVRDMSNTGTSISGVAHAFPNHHSGTAFPLKIYSSTMPRAGETVSWDDYDFPVNQLSTLNP